MGSQLIKGYDIEPKPTSIGGYKGQWQITTGTKQDKSKQLVSIFLFDKKERLKSISKLDQEKMLEFLRHQVTNSSLLNISHRATLTILEPLQEDAQSLGFVTEKLQSSLHSILTNKQYTELYSSETELKLHVHDLLDCLQTIHSNNYCYLSVSPEHVFINQEGKWIFGLAPFIVQIQEGSQLQQTLFEFQNQSGSSCHPNLFYLPPETANYQSQCHYKSDIYSLGMLLCVILKAIHEKTVNALAVDHTMTYDTYQQKISGLKNDLLGQQFMSKIDKNLQTILTRMIDRNIRCRPSLDEIRYCA